MDSGLATSSRPGMTNCQVSLTNSSVALFEKFAHENALRGIMPASPIFLGNKNAREIFNA